MDISSNIAGSSPNDDGSAIEYTAQVVSPIINGEAKMTIREKSISISELFSTVEILFAEINELKLADYVITVKADSGNYILSRMGNWCQPFYDALCDAYNNAVLRSLFIKAQPVFKAKGDYHFSEIEKTTTEVARLLYKRGMSSGSIHVYENNVTALPPNLSARRVPLCFVNGINKSGFELTLKLDTGESYTYARLGYETTHFAEAIERQIRKLREKTHSAIRSIDPTLTTTQASQLTGLMPQGSAAPIGQLSRIAPSFAKAMENKIAATRAANSFSFFKELCDPEQIWVGFRENEGSGDGKNPDNHQLPFGISQQTEQGDSKGGDKSDATDLFMIWMIAPSPNGRFAAVEFAEADSATFVYCTDGEFTAFARQLNHALEAINFRREVIRLTDSELMQPENADYYMAAKRTASLQFVRSSFAGRVIHSSEDAWKRKLTELWAPPKT